MKTNKNYIKYILLALLCMSMLAFGVACNDETKSTGKDGDTNASGPGIDKEEQSEAYSVKLYFVNDEYVNTGDESIPHLSGPFDHDMVKGKDTSDNQYYMLINNVLRIAPTPEDAASGSASTLIFDGIQFNSVEVKDGTAYVDVKSEANGELLSGGSLEERLLIEQITFSLIDSFEEVNQVQFLVDGENAETLMGHMDITEPFDKDDFDTDDDNEAE